MKGVCTSIHPCDLQVMEAELKGTNPEMASVFLAAAAAGSLNEPSISLASLGRTFGPLQHQVRPCTSTSTSTRPCRPGVAIGWSLVVTLRR